MANINTQHDFEKSFVSCTCTICLKNREILIQFLFDQFNKSDVGLMLINRMLKFCEPKFKKSINSKLKELLYTNSVIDDMQSCRTICNKKDQIDRIHTENISNITEFLLFSTMLMVNNPFLLQISCPFICFIKAYTEGFLETKSYSKPTGKTISYAVQESYGNTHKSKKIWTYFKAFEDMFLKQCPSTRFFLCTPLYQYVYELLNVLDFIIKMKESGLTAKSLILKHNNIEKKINYFGKYWVKVWSELHKFLLHKVSRRKHSVKDVLYVFNVIMEITSFSKNKFLYNFNFDDRNLILHNILLYKKIKWPNGFLKSHICNEKCEICSNILEHHNETANNSNEHENSSLKAITDRDGSFNKYQNESLPKSSHIEDHCCENHAKKKDLKKDCAHTRVTETRHRLRRKIQKIKNYDKEQNSTQRQQQNVSMSLINSTSVLNSASINEHKLLTQEEKPYCFDSKLLASEAPIKLSKINLNFERNNDNGSIQLNGNDRLGVDNSIYKEFDNLSIKPDKSAALLSKENDVPKRKTLRYICNNKIQEQEKLNANINFTKSSEHSDIVSKNCDKLTNEPEVVKKWVDKTLYFIEGSHNKSQQPKPSNPKKAAKKVKQKLKKEAEKQIIELQKLRHQFLEIYFKEFTNKHILKSMKSIKNHDKKKKINIEINTKKLQRSKATIETQILELIATVKQTNSEFKFSYLPTKEQQLERISKMNNLSERSNRTTSTQSNSTQIQNPTVPPNSSTETNASRHECNFISSNESKTLQNFESSTSSNKPHQQPIIHTGAPNRNFSITSNSNGSKNSDSSQGIVTIRRINLPNVHEPQVTVTAKGTTPDEDRLLYTFVNGQIVQSVNLEPVIEHQKSNNLFYHSSINKPKIQFPNNSNEHGRSDAPPMQDVTLNKTVKMKGLQRCQRSIQKEKKCSAENISKSNLIKPIAVNSNLDKTNALKKTSESKYSPNQIQIPLPRNDTKKQNKKAITQKQNLNKSKKSTEIEEQQTELNLIKKGKQKTNLTINGSNKTISVQNIEKSQIQKSSNCTEEKSVTKSKTKKLQSKPITFDDGKFDNNPFKSLNFNYSSANETSSTSSCDNSDGENRKEKYTKKDKNKSKNQIISKKRADKLQQNSVLKPFNSLIQNDINSSNSSNKTNASNSQCCMHTKSTKKKKAASNNFSNIQNSKQKDNTSVNNVSLIDKPQTNILKHSENDKEQLNFYEYNDNYDCPYSSSKRKANTEIEPKMEKFNGVNLTEQLRNLQISNDYFHNSNKNKVPLTNVSIMDQLNQGVQVEDLSLPPGITLTKVDPIKSEELRQKSESINNISKPLLQQNTLNSYKYVEPKIITSQLKSSCFLNHNYIGFASSPITNESNVIMVETNSTPKEDKSKLLNAKTITEEIDTTKKKKTKKKRKNVIKPTSAQQSKTITLRNPMFQAGPVDSLLQKTELIQDSALSDLPLVSSLPFDQPAAIFKNENGMFTIRNPALHQAVTSGLAVGGMNQYNNINYFTPKEVEHSRLNQNISSVKSCMNKPSYSYYSNSMNNNECENRKKRKTVTITCSSMKSLPNNKLQEKQKLLTSNQISLQEKYEQSNYYSGLNPFSADNLKNQSSCTNTSNLKNSYLTTRSSDNKMPLLQRPAFETCAKSLSGGGIHNSDNVHYLTNLLPEQNLNSEVSIHSLNDFNSKCSYLMPIENQVEITPVNTNRLKLENNLLQRDNQKSEVLTNSQTNFCSTGKDTILSSRKHILNFNNTIDESSRGNIHRESFQSKEIDFNNLSGISSNWQKVTKLSDEHFMDNFIQNLSSISITGPLDKKEIDENKTNAI